MKLTYYVISESRVVAHGATMRQTIDALGRSASRCLEEGGEGEVYFQEGDEDLIELRGLDRVEWDGIMQDCEWFCPPTWHT